jgi:NADH-quinone oxidoreductase subunit C
VTESLREKLQATFKDLQITVPAESRVAVTVRSDSVPVVLRFLKDRGLDHLALVSAVDWIEEGVFELCFILTSYMQNDDEVTDRERLHIILKTMIPREKPQFKTVTGIFLNAEPYEREIHELFGINFEGHKRLTPLFLEREYEIPPFRKDFDTRKYVEDVFGNIPSVEAKEK